MTFKGLFHHQEKPDDGLTQPEREAIVDILNYCMFADKVISLSEDAMIEATARKLNWDPKMSFEYYEGKSISTVRRALEDKDYHNEFMESLRSRLTDTDHRKLAFKLADDLTKADGVKSPEEFQALTQLRVALEG